MKAKLLVSRYPLHSCRVSGKKFSQACPMCDCCDETIEHFLVQRPALAADRDPILKMIISPVDDPNTTKNPSTLTQLLLDSSLIECDGLADQVELVEALSRKLCFKLHHRRSVHIGNGSQYLRVNRRRVAWLQN